MSTRLFQIKDLSSRKPIKDLYFDNKVAAKAKRRELNSDGVKYYVAPGPDHWRFRE